MVKVFKIIENIVYGIAALAIVALMAMISIGSLCSFGKVQPDWSSFLMYLYIAAAVVIIYKTIVVCHTSLYQKEIDT